MLKHLEVQFITIGENELGQRVDNFLRTKLKGVPKTMIYRIIRKGEVRVNKGRVKPDRKLQVGDVVRVPPVKVVGPGQAVPVSQQLQEKLTQAILFENSGFMAVNKPAGLAVHGGSGVTLGLIEALRQSFPQHDYLELVHRLDRDTSGVVLIAKKRSTLKYLQSLFRGQKQIKKTYVALVDGAWPTAREWVDAPLLRTERKSKERVVRVSNEGKASRTRFTARLQFSNFATLVNATPVTGRTHQIRVHAQHVGCSLAGDPKYGREAFSVELKPHGLNRLFLHASQLEFNDADEQPICIRAPLATDLLKTLKSMAARYNCDGEYRQWLDAQ